MRVYSKVITCAIFLVGLNYSFPSNAQDSRITGNCNVVVQGNGITANVSPCLPFPCAVSVLRQFNFGTIPALDGDRNHVGDVANVVVTIRQECASPTLATHKVNISYGWYNGSGTWRGEQHVILVLKNSTGGALSEPLNFGLDRGRCWYGATHPEGGEKELNGGVGILVASAVVTVTPVHGVQTRC
jgi:hypothetical protein